MTLQARSDYCIDSCQLAVCMSPCLCAICPVLICGSEAGGSEAGGISLTATHQLLLPVRYVLRNWIAQQAIEKAEKGDYGEVQRVLKLLEHPFSDTIAAEIAEKSKDEAACSRTLLYDGAVPAWAAGLCVSCSS